MRALSRVISGLVLLALGSSAQAALLSRAGGQAYYDDVLNITWLADANLADTNAFGVTGIDADNGTMPWAKANEWIGAMNSANYLGVNTWRLPTVSPLNGSSFNYSWSYNGSTDLIYNQSEQGTAYAGSTGSEMAHMYYNTLDNQGPCDPVLSTVSSCVAQVDWWGLANTGPFSNLRPYVYWSGTTYAPDPSSAWHFEFGYGLQGPYDKGYSGYAWAVSSGDALVPVPAAVWLFGSALGVMGLLRRVYGAGFGLLAC